LLLGELMPLLPPERERDVHLIATAMAIASREARSGGWQREVAALIQELCGDDGKPASTPILPRKRGREPDDARASNPPLLAGEGGRAAGGWGCGAEDATLLRRFALDLRNGAFETSPSRAATVRAILWRLTIAKLRENNPHFLAANGIAGEGNE
jgi:hypothetical protein